MDFVVRSYTPEDKERWDAFVDGAKNTTFMFRRDYIEYHGDRFEEASLMIFDTRGELWAILPANRQRDEAVSHAGLTYAGFAYDSKMTVSAMLDVFAATSAYLRGAGVKTLLYKTVPHIYHRDASEEDLHALFANGARLVRRDVLSVIDYSAADRWEPHLRYRLREGRKAVRAGFEVRETSDWSAFWELLTGTLARRHGAQPVHSLDEIELLASRFPDQIRLLGAYRGDDLEAGAVVYVSNCVCHVQYSANSDEGRRERAHDLFFAEVISRFRARVRYFDFGISSEQEGRVMNEGLLWFKERFGARAVVHDFYRLDLDT